MQALVIAQEVPATMRFDRETLYTFRLGPNAGRAVRYVGPAEGEFRDRVRVVTADGQPFGAPNGKRYELREGMCLPADLVVK